MELIEDTPVPDNHWIMKDFLSYGILPSALVSHPFIANTAQILHQLVVYNTASEK